MKDYQFGLTILSVIIIASIGLTAFGCRPAPTDSTSVYQPSQQNIPEPVQKSADMIIYQIYPRSFRDSNGDGIGDLPGIIGKLDYLQSLGVNTIWFSPFFQSPQEDFGYDVSDYYAISPEYGTMADFDSLLREMHSRNMKMILDLPLNHTSIDHPWFKESASSRDNPKRDWYI